MSDWSIDIPHYGDRDDPVSEIGFAARDLPESERAVVCKLTLDAIEAGTETVGEFFAQLEGLGVAGRRQLLDKARSACRMETTTVLDQRREDAHWESQFQRLQPPPPPRWSELQACPAKGCNARPTTPEGALRPVSVNQWWCPRHEHLAPEEDLQPYEPAYVGLSHTGRPIPSEKERARIEAWHREREESEERERQLREEHLRREWEAVEEARLRWEAEGEISVGGIRCRPDGRPIQ